MYSTKQAAATTGPTFHTPARSSGRMQHMALALELMQLSMRCRISHPKLATVLEAAADTAIAEQRATGATPALLEGLPLRGRASDLARTLHAPTIADSLREHDRVAQLQADERAVRRAVRRAERTADDLAAEIVADLRASEEAARVAQRTRDEQDARALTGDTTHDIAAQQRAEEHAA